MDVSRGSVHILITLNYSDSEMLALTDGTQILKRNTLIFTIRHITLNVMHAFMAIVQLHGWLLQPWKSNSNIKEFKYERARMCF